MGIPKYGVLLLLIIRSGRLQYAFPVLMLAGNLRISGIRLEQEKSAPPQNSNARLKELFKVIRGVGGCASDYKS